MRKVIALSLCLHIVMLFFIPATARSQFGTIKTRDMRLIYNEFTLSFLATHVGRCFENAMDYYRDVFRYTPSEPVTIFLDDTMDYNNAAAWSAPRNTLWVQIAPTNRVYETAPSNERINHTMNHELAHIAMQDQAAGSDVFFRKIFGGKVAQTAEHPETIFYSYSTQPRRLSPRWYHEGAAVFLETWMAGGIGRAQGPYDEMVFRSMVRDGAHFYDAIGLESEGTKIDFQAGVNAYLYGTRFMSYLAHEYGPESVIQWIARSPGSKKYYTSQFKNVYGISLGDAWKQWIEWEHAFQAVNLDSVRRYELTPYRDLSDKALGSVSRAFHDPERQRLYVAANYPGVVGHIAAIDLNTGDVERLVDISGPAMYFVTSLAYDPRSDVLFYTSHNYEWRDLYRLDLNSGKSRRLFKDARIGDLAYALSDSTLWGIRHFNGISTLVRIPPPYDEWYQVYSPDYGDVIYDIDISPDGQNMSFSFSEMSGQQTLRMMKVEDLLNGVPQDELIYDFGCFLPGNFVFSPNGEYLFGSSYSTGISNIWRYDVAADSMDCVTNCETGMFRPVPTTGDSLFVFRYTGSGFVPSTLEARPLEDVSAITFLGQQIAAKYPVVEDWNVGSPLAVDLDSVTVYTGPYKGLSHIGLSTIYPMVQGYKEFAAFGFAAQFSDPGYVHAIDVDLSYTFNNLLPAEERLHAYLNYAHGPWALDFKHNVADFYDLFGPLKTSRKGQALGLSYKTSLLNDKPKSLNLSISTSGYINLETLPYAQNVDATYDKLWSSVARLNYRNMVATIGSVNMEKGFGWGVNLANNYADKRSFPLGWLEFDFGFPFLFQHSSLWLRSSAGYSPGDRDVSFSNFFFGGFQNNYIDHRSVKRYHEFDTFPGIEINEIGGTNFSKVLLEWNLPPVRFKHYGTSWYYLTWLRMSLFGSGLVTNMDDDLYRTTAANVGGQVDLRFTLLSRLQMTLSLGYAAAFAEDQPYSDEFMFSLKILR